MAGEKPDVLLIGNKKPVIVGGLQSKVNLHVLFDAPDREAFFKSHGDKIRALAVAYTADKVDAGFMQRFPRLEQISSFGVGYDHIDAKWAGAHGIVVTNTPEVLNEEVADTALGLLLCTVREFPRAERYLRAGKWVEKQFPLTKATLRNRTVGMVGMGRIGKAIARRLEAFGVPVVYHSRNPQPGVAYKYYPKLVDMARGSVVDEPALIQALKDRTIYSAGLDVFAKEPQVPAALMEMDHIVLFPHLGSSTEVTRAAMDQLVVDNIVAWAGGQPPLTPVPETPYPPKRG
jgi:hypothetical protein